MSVCICSSSSLSSSDRRYQRHSNAAGSMLAFLMTFLLASSSIIVTVHGLQQQQQQSQQQSPEIGKSLSDEFKEGPIAASSYLPEEEFEKRAGFMPMRGRKSMINNDENDIDNNEQQFEQNGELELIDLLDKRSRINSFMPMRGRRMSQYYFSPKPIQYWWPSAFRWRSGRTASNSDSGFDSAANKRAKGVAFFGSRGKRSISVN